MPPLLRRLCRRVLYGEPIIVVSGLPRSGTSMLMKMLDAGGLDLVMDGLRGADEDNPGGYYELERVKDLAQEKDKTWLTAFRGKGIKVISYLLKELPPSNNYKVLFVQRDLDEILTSQAKMLARRGESPSSDHDRMVELFKTDLWKANYLLTHAPQFEMLEVRYRDVLGSATEQARRIACFLGRSLDVEAMADVVDPSLYRNRSPRAAGKTPNAHQP